MRPPKRRPPYASFVRSRALSAAAVLALAGMGGCPACAAAAAPAADSPAPPAPGPNDLVRFAADTVSYDNTGDTVTATGNVVLRRDAQSLRADRLVWDRKTGVITANGNARFVDEDGDVLYTDTITLTDTFKTGATQDLLIVLREGGRIAANSSTRDAQERVVLDHGVYSGCDVTDENGCPRKPSWVLSAVRVVYDPAHKRVRYYGATLRVLGMPILPLPGLSHPSDFSAASGILNPGFGLSAANGLQITNTYYWRFSSNRDLAASAEVFTNSVPLFSAHYRELRDNGAYQITGYVTYSRQENAVSSTTGTLLTAGTGGQTLRGYLDANGRIELDEAWSVTGAARYVSDRTFLLRYGLSADTRLRSTVDLERNGDDSYFSLAGWAIQGIVVNDVPSRIPFVLPALDWRRRFHPGVVPGRIEIEVNSLALSRTDAQDTQRALARAQWDYTSIGAAGEEITLTALVRGDVYHSGGNTLVANPVYQGLPGWQARGIVTGAIDVKWPLVGTLFGGTQVLTPEVQLVATPHLRNLAIPDEDSQAVELETDNIFALNRYPGYDRVEDGVRVTYGLDWRFEQPGWRASATIGQSWRTTNETALVPTGTGLAERQSDVVGRVQLRFRDVVQLTERFQLDKDTLGLRRNEFDATIGNHRTYLEFGYIALNRGIPLIYEGLQDNKELRTTARVGFARVWSAFGSVIVNLTTTRDNPQTGSNGFQLIRHRLGFAYSDGCLDIAVTWRRDYVTTGDAVRGNSFALTFSLKNIGTR